MAATMAGGNPYTRTSAAAGAKAYGQQAKAAAPEGRELEAHVLLKAAARLEGLREGWHALDREAVAAVLAYNRKAWLLFYDTAVQREEEAQAAGGVDETDPATSVRRNIIQLARFTFKRELDILAAPGPEKLGALISINRNIAAGLMGQPGGQDTAAE